jgi:hypothetical protein
VSASWLFFRRGLVYLRIPINLFHQLFGLAVCYHGIEAVSRHLCVADVVLPLSLHSGCLTLSIPRASMSNPRPLKHVQARRHVEECNSQIVAGHSFLILPCDLLSVWPGAVDPRRLPCLCANQFLALPFACEGVSCWNDIVCFSFFDRLSSVLRSHISWDSYC